MLQSIMWGPSVQRGLVIWRCCGGALARMQHAIMQGFRHSSSHAAKARRSSSHAAKARHSSSRAANASGYDASPTAISRTRKY
jgi:hypothetical protein